MTSALVTRLSGSKATWRPEWVTGWKATARTAGWAMPKRTIVADLVFVQAPFDGSDQR